MLLGAAPVLGAVFDFVFTFFDIDIYLKRYVGGLGVSASQSQHIGSLASAMMRVTSFTVLRLLLFRQLEHRTEDCFRLEYTGTDVRRFDVKDSNLLLST